MESIKGLNFLVGLESKKLLLKELLKLFYLFIYSFHFIIVSQHSFNRLYYLESVYYWVILLLILLLLLLPLSFVIFIIPFIIDTPPPPHPHPLLLSLIVPANSSVLFVSLKCVLLVIVEGCGVLFVFPFLFLFSH